MSNPEEESSAETEGIADEKLPEDLQPSEDNPLAEGLEEGETVDDLLEGGKTAEQGEPEDQGDDSDTGSGSGAS
ncbi:MAG: hypothetical protein M3237_02105 [Actinomycetota bacterium]|nr:hypothetical protein [Actinomycetota bacterium]